MSGARNHHATVAATRTTNRPTSRSTPLRQPFTVPDLVHHSTRLSNALHKVDGRDEHRFLVVQAVQRAGEPGEVARPGLARGAPEREMRAKRPSLRGKAER